MKKRKVRANARKKLFPKIPKSLKLAFDSVVITAITTAVLIYFLFIGMKECTFLSKKTCTTDDECICGGIEKKTGECFIGNIRYFSLCVNPEKQCPDFCGGIGSNLQTKCINGECVQVHK